MVTRRLALSSLFNGNKARDTAPLSPPPPLTTARPAAWPWPSSNSKNPRAQSTSTTRAALTAGARTVASVVLDSAGDSSSFTASSAAARQDDYCCSDSLSTASEASASAPQPGAGDDAAADDAVVVRGLRSDRLLFDPPGASATSSILDEKSSSAAAKEEEQEDEAFGGAVAVAFESADPYADFRASMEEMVAAHGVVGDWGWLEQMLGWYLRANDGDTHCAVVAAFIDVVVAIADPARQAQACASSQTSTTCTFAVAAGEAVDVAEKGGKPPAAGVLAVSCLD